MRIDLLLTQVNKKQKTMLVGWGNGMLAAAEKKNPGLTKFLRTLQHPVPVWCDFAGADAPIWGLQELEVAHEEVTACEWNHGAQKFLFRNMSPSTFDANIFKRQLPDPSRRAVILFGGFPCKAFSWLRSGNTGLLNDEEAKGFWAEMDTIKVSYSCIRFNVLACVCAHRRRWAPAQRACVSGCTHSYTVFCFCVASDRRKSRRSAFLKMSKACPKCFRKSAKS